MRLMLAGADTGPVIPDPKVIEFVSPGTDTFDRDNAIAEGYTDFEVLVVGGAGGQGGSFFRSSDFNIFYGGGGGGGGSHRVTGKLIDLPSLVPVVVGSAGADSFSDGGPGGDGGASTFNGSTARASGGKGGAGGTNGTRGAGGLGGLGNRTTAGGGPAYSAGNGTWDGTVGSGGAGGSGSRFDGWNSGYILTPTSGRSGTVSASEPQYTNPGAVVSTTPPNASYSGGPGGGVNAHHFGGVSWGVFGRATGESETVVSASAHGAVLVRLTAVYTPPVLDPLVIFEQPGSYTLDTQPYRDFGYTNFDVIVVGGAGGVGGESRMSAVGGWFATGGGGGGGIHRVTGSLASLPVEVPVVVGAGGADGAWSSTGLGEAGEAGGASTFNGTTAQASGGEGSPVIGGLEPGRTGASGGVGGRTATGGAGNGGFPGSNNSGFYNTTTGIGTGAGGGYGGAVWDSSNLNNPSPVSTKGGDTTGGGADFNVTGGGIGSVSGHRRANNGGGAGAGYKVRALTGSEKAYGTGANQSALRTKDGVVVVRFS